MKYLALVILAFLSMRSELLAQTIHFEKDSLGQVFAKAQQQNKPVLVVLAGPALDGQLPPLPNEVSRKSGLAAPAISAVLNKEFLTKEMPFEGDASAALKRNYSVVRYPTYFYFNPDGALLYRSTGSYTAEAHYLNDLKAFRQAQADPHNLSYYQAEFQKGNRSADFLKQYLLKRRELEQRVEPSLLDAYVQQLPVKAFRQGSEVLFVLENGPVVSSQAYQLTHSGNKLTDSLYRTLPLPQRMAINNRIINNTMAEATATKNVRLAMEGANFARTTWTTNYVRGTRAYDNNMLAFYHNTKDTTNYLRQAVSFYERYGMNVSADSAAKTAASIRAFRQQQAVGLPATSRVSRPAEAADKAKLLDPKITRVVTTIVSSSPPHSFVTELNNGAWNVYQTGTHNREYLLRATLWSKRAVELDPAAYDCDTLAHLLYRLQFFEEAEAKQQQAVNYARQEKISPLPYEQALQKMKKRQL
jgi:hypothetical protein